MVIIMPASQARHWHNHDLPYDAGIITIIKCCMLLVLIEDEFKPGDEKGSDDDDLSSGVDEDDVTDDTASEPDSPIKVSALGS